MKSYKLVNSPLIKDKLFKMGLDMSSYNWHDPFVLIHGESCNTITSSNNYGLCCYEEITQLGFLSLKEPFEIGDFVKAPNLIFKVTEINGDCLCNYENGIDFYEGICTKLTKEQIKILELI